MILITKQQQALMLANGRANQEAQGSLDLKPVVKLFTPDAQCTWLLSELDPDRPEIAFGLCDLGIGFTELGAVSLDELRQLRGRLGLPVERDRSFEADKTLSKYALRQGSRAILQPNQDRARPMAWRGSLFMA